ncbi:MAG: hypothetical protein RLZZ385_2003 [Pseudomonadota bacterium]|jgi:hypothetical protein
MALSKTPKTPKSPRTAISTPTTPDPSHTAFRDDERLCSGSLEAVALHIHQNKALAGKATVLIFNDHTGEQVDVDISGGERQIRKRYGAPVPPPVSSGGRGRPRLGVVGKEITLLPRHWEWLSLQPGGASVALRKLIDQARKSNQAADDKRRSQVAANRFMSAMAGNLPGYEEATRALFAGDKRRFAFEIELWPRDVRAYAMGLAATALS